MIFFDEFKFLVIDTLRQELLEYLKQKNCETVWRTRPSARNRWEKNEREKNQGGMVGYIYVLLLMAIFIIFENF